MLPSCSFPRGLLNLVLKFSHVMRFYAMHVSFVQVHYAFPEKPDNPFWTRLKEMTFALVGKRSKHLDSSKYLCIHQPTTESLSRSKIKNFWWEWIQNLYTNVVDGLVVATSQSKNGRREQMLRIHINQLVLIRVLFMH